LVILGVVVDESVPVMVRFTDLATGRATLAEVDTFLLPDLVVEGPLELAPGHSVRAEVVACHDDAPGAPVAFLPLITDEDGNTGPAAYAVECVDFVTIKSFNVDGSLFPAGPRTIILDR
jgi:hypothetical protein